MESFSSPYFISMIAYGCVAIPIYLLVILVILRYERFSTSFFRLFVILGVINIGSYFCKFVIIRLPLFTCGSCSLGQYFYNRSYWWLMPMLVAHRVTFFGHAWLACLITIDRFIVIVLNSRISMFWNRFSWAFVASILVPIAILFSAVFGEDARYIYVQRTDNFRAESTADSFFVFHAGILIIGSTVLVGVVFNSLVFIHLRNISFRELQHRAEVKLFAVSVVELTLQVSTILCLIFLKLSRSEHPSAYYTSRIALLYATDALSLFPPFVLIFTCDDLRNQLRALFFRLQTPDSRSSQPQFV